MDKKKEKLLLWLTLAGFSMVGVSILLMMPHPRLTSQTVSLAAGILFWLALATGFVCQSRLSHRRKAWERKNRKRSSWKQAGAICFFRNKPAMVADIGAIVSLIGLVISLVLTNAAGYACYVFLALLIAFFAAHSIFNGKNYRYVFSK